MSGRSCAPQLRHPTDRGGEVGIFPSRPLSPSAASASQRGGSLRPNLGAEHLIPQRGYSQIPLHNVPKHLGPRNGHSPPALPRMCSCRRRRLCGGTSRASVHPGRVGRPRARGQACRSSSHIFTSKSWLIPHPCTEQGSRRRQDLAHGYLQPPRCRNYFPLSAEERNQAFLRDINESSTSPFTLCTDPRGG